MCPRVVQSEPAQPNPLALTFLLFGKGDKSPSSDNGSPSADQIRCLTHTAAFCWCFRMRPTRQAGAVQLFGSYSSRADSNFDDITAVRRPKGTTPGRAFSAFSLVHHARPHKRNPAGMSRREFWPMLEPLPSLAQHCPEDLEFGRSAPPKVRRHAFFHRNRHGGHRYRVPRQ
jgi:hypothetical protein